MSEIATRSTSSGRGRPPYRSRPFKSAGGRGGGRGGSRKHWDSDPAAGEASSEPSALGLETSAPQAPSAPKSTQPPVVGTTSHVETKSSDKRSSSYKPKPRGRKTEPEASGSQADPAPPTTKGTQAAPTNQGDSASSTDGAANHGGSRGNGPRGRERRGGKARGSSRGVRSRYEPRGDKSVTGGASNDTISTDHNIEQDSSSSYSSVATPIGSHSTLAPFEETSADSSFWSGGQPTDSKGKQPERVEHVTLDAWAEVQADENIWKTEPSDNAWGTDPAIVQTLAPTPMLPTRDAPRAPRNPPPRHDTRSQPLREERQSRTPRETQSQPAREEKPITPRPAPAESPRPSHPPQPVQPPMDDSPTELRRIGFAYVLLGPGACVQHVFTDAESPWVMLSNLPSRIGRRKIEELVTPYGSTRYIKIYEPKGDTRYLATARILFDQHEQARAAVSGLQGRTVGRRPITARLDTSAAGGGLNGGFVPGLSSTSSGTEAAQSTSLVASDPATTLRNASVKVSWFAPTSTAYATYATGKFAMERIKDLNGRTFGNRRLHMAPMFSERDQNIKQVVRESGGYMVRITGLMGSPDMEALKRFIRTQDISVHPNYSSENGLTRLRQDLEDVAPLESFRLLPNRRDDYKLHAVAQYTTPTAAAAAVKVFEGRRGEYLANSPVRVYRNLTVKYSISARLTEVLQGEINKLHAWAIDDPDLHVRQQDDIYKPGSVLLSLSGNDTKQLVAAKAQLDRALAGVPLTDADGLKIWDPYFTTEEGIAVLDSVATSTKICARADRRTNSILLFGPGYARNDASKALLAELERLRGMRQKMIIPKPVFRRLSGGGLTILRKLVGKGNIYVDIIGQSLTFYGDAQVVRQVQKAIDVMYSEVGTRLQRHSDCVVCLCRPEDGFMLHCGHHYCKECFSQYVASAADNKTLPLVCVGKDCKAPIPLSMITQHANQSDQDDLFYAAFQGHVAANPDQYRYCPTPDCQYIYRVGPEDAIVQCRLCLLNICTHCHVEQHENISCADYKASHDETEIQKSFNRWQAAHDVKPCPNCSAPIEKIAGCNHMMCSNCRHHMCWVCLAGFKTSEKVYDHMRAQHGGIGL